jgi:hypothetical protein
MEVYTSIATKIHNMRFQVFIMVKIQVVITWVMILCSLIGGYHLLALMASNPVSYSTYYRHLESYKMHYTS